MNDPQTVEITVGTASQLTKLLATYGIYALVILYMFYQQKVERNSLAAAKNPKDETYYRKRGTVVLGVTILLSVLAAGVWFYGTFLYKSKVVIEGRVRNLPEHKELPARLGDKPMVLYRLDALRGDGRFYSSRATSLGDSNLDLEWALITPRGLNTVQLMFQQEFCTLESDPQDFQIATLDQQAFGTRLQRGAPIKIATIDFRAYEKFLDEPIQLVYEPAASVKEIGKLFIVHEKGKTPIPWDEGNPISLQPSPPAKSAFLGMGVAWAQGQEPSQIFGLRGEVSPEMFQRLKQYLESEDLKQQVVAQDALVQGGARSFPMAKKLLQAASADPPARNRLVHNIASAIGTIETLRTRIPWDLSLALAQALYELGDYELSARFFSKIPDSQELPTRESHQRALAYLNAKRYNEAEREFLKLLQESGNADQRSRITTNLGTVYSREGKWEDAITVYRRALSLDSKNVTALYNLGSIEMQLGNYAEGEKLFAQGHAINPENPSVLNGLAYSYAQQGKNLDLALTYVNQALATNGENPQFLDTKGWVLYKSGQPRLALSYLEKALQKVPADKEIKAHRDEVRRAL